MDSREQFECLVGIWNRRYFLDVGYGRRDILRPHCLGVIELIARVFGHSLYRVRESKIPSPAFRVGVYMASSMESNCMRCDILRCAASLLSLPSPARREML